MQTPHWFLDERAHAGGEHLDEGYVATYDGKAAVDPAEDLAVLRAWGLDESATLLDFGAGTGTFALAAAPFCRRVIAVDVSPAMLARLLENAARLGIANVECREGGFLTYQHADDPVDAIYSRHAMHHLPDFWKAIALDRTAAMLRPGGVLRLRDIVYSFEPHEAAQYIEAWLAQAAAQPEVGWTRAELETHVREEHSTFGWILASMLEEAGLAIKEATYSESRIYAAYTCIKLSFCIKF
jgi:SAM-dependent methyltransferase